MSSRARSKRKLDSNERSFEFSSSHESPLVAAQNAPENVMNQTAWTEQGVDPAQLTSVWLQPQLNDIQSLTAETQPIFESTAEESRNSEKGPFTSDATSAALTTSPNVKSRYFACPFYRLDPGRYSECGHVGKFESVSRLK
jgi:hypothetical protein